MIFTLISVIFRGLWRTIIVTLAKDMLGNRGNHISYDDLTDNISADVPVTFIGVF